MSKINMSDTTVACSSYLTIRFDQMEDGRVLFHPMPDYRILLPFRDKKTLVQLADEGEPLSVLGMFALTKSINKYIIECLDAARVAQSIALKGKDVAEKKFPDEVITDTTNFH